MSSVQSKTLITLTLKLPDLEVDVTKEVSLDQLRRINAQVTKIYEDSNLILGKISVSTHSSCSLSFDKEVFNQRVEAAWSWIQTQSKLFTADELAEAIKIPRTSSYPILNVLEKREVIRFFKIGRKYCWGIIPPKNNIKPSTPGNIEVESVEQANFRQNVAEQKTLELKARIDSR